MPEQSKLLESGIPLSKSLIWPLQQSIFEKLGLEAWTKKGVPSYMTSNPLTAHKYAHLVLAYLRDCLAPHSTTPINRDAPVYIFDTGVGTGRFAYVFLKQLLAMMTALPQFAGLKLCYVMTDIVAANLTFCREHAYLQSYFEQGILETAYYNHSQTEPLQLLVSKRTLTTEEIRNPIIVIANYFFDAISKDLFCYREGILHEGTITLKSDASSSSLSTESLLKDPALLTKMRYCFDYRPIARDKMYYPDDAVLQHILEEYSSRLDGVPFTLPLSATTTIRYFQKLSQGRLFLIAGAQGFATLEQLKRAGEPQIAIHGSFSIPVNFHALARYFDRQKGKGWLSSSSDPIFQVFCGVFGGTGSDFPETSLAYREQIDSFEPKDYWKISTLIQNEAQAPSLEMMLLILKLGYYDSMNFHAFFNMIREQIPDASLRLREELRRTIHSLWEYFYPIQALEGEFVMNLGVLLFEIQHYAEALAFFQRSLELTGENAITYRNMAACYMALFNAEAAHRCLEKAQQLTPA